MRTLLVALLLPTFTFAGEFNKKLSIGDAAPAWKDLPGTDGKKHSLAELKSDVVVVVFTCNSCATAQEYEDRLVAFAKDQPAKVAVVAINVNTIAEDRLDAMKKKAEAKQFPFAYLYDESQKIAQEYGATYTPSSSSEQGPQGRLHGCDGRPDQGRRREVKAWRTRSPRC